MAGACNMEARMIIAQGNPVGMEDKAYKVWLDVPGSGLGVLKRNPDAKWKLSAETVERTKTLQKQIISSYSEMVKISGHLVYSTCSILPSENQAQVKDFMALNGRFELVKEKTILPSQGFD